MQFTHEDRKPTPFETLLAGAGVGLLVVFILAALSQFSPESFADAAQKRADIEEQTEHLEMMNDLIEQNKSNAIENAKTRRSYWTTALLAVAWGVGMIAVSYGFRVAAVNVARGVQALREIPRQPLPLPMRNGYTALPDKMTGHLLDERTGRVGQVGNLDASPERAKLEQVDSIGASTVQAARHDPKVADWLPGILQTMASEVNREP